MNKCTILIFSSRPDGNCAKISNYVLNYHTQTNVKCFNINSQNFAPCNHCNYECLQKSAACPNITREQIEIMDSICDSDLVYFIVPNYCGNPCANYFAFNERSVGYFSLNAEQRNGYRNVRKKFIIVSNTEGFERALQLPHEAPEILYLKSSKYQKRSTAGDILDSEEAKHDLDMFLAGEVL